jgi:hypothetical protein
MLFVAGMSPVVALRVISRVRNNHVAFQVKRHQMAGRIGWLSRE